MVRILVVANSYPTVAAPSGAPYLTNRLVRLARRPGVTVRALALAPRYGPLTAAARRRAGLLPNEALALPENEAGRRYEAVVCTWRPTDVIAGRLGRIPMGLVARAAAAVLVGIGRQPDGTAGSARFDVVHAHGMYTLPAGAVAERVAAALEIPFVVSMHGSDVAEVMPRRAGAYREILGRAGATTYVSQALRDRAVALGAPADRAHVIPNGVDLAVFGPGEPDAGGSAARAVPGGPPRVLFVGNLLSVKGADRLPEIMRALRARIPGATLDVAGDGPLRPLLEAEAAAGVRCHGRLEPAQVAGLMRAASVLVVPSRAEGWGCVIGEAYACGTPVVGSDVGGIPEALGGFTAPVSVHHGEGGDAGGDAGDDESVAEAFAARIAQVVSRPPDAAALTRHVAGRDWDAVVDAELKVLTGVVGSTG